MSEPAYEMPPEPGLLTLEQAAFRLGVSKRTVQRLVAEGLLEQVYVRSSPRIDPAEITRYLERPRPRRRRRSSSLRPVSGSDDPGFVDRLRSQRR